MRADDWSQVVAFLERCRTHPTAMAVVRDAVSPVLYNDACAALLGRSHPAVRGEPWQAAWPELFDLLGGGHDARRSGATLYLVGADGTRTELRCDSAPIVHGDDDRAVASLTIFHAVQPLSMPVTTRGRLSGGRLPRAVATAAGDDGDVEAGFASLDVGTVCATLGAVLVPAHASWITVWFESTDTSGVVRLEHRDVPARRRHGRAAPAKLANRLGVSRVMATGETVRRASPGGYGLPDGEVLTVPLRDTRRIIGAVSLGRVTGHLDEEWLRGVIDRAGVALANALRFRLEHGISRDLQRMLAPRALPSIPGVELDAALQAGAGGLPVSGDWFDVAERPDGRVAVTIGDMVGHGLRSAFEMSQLRSGVRNLAMEGLSPVEVLERADEFLRRTGEARYATCLHAVYDPRSGWMDLANAGHLRPLYLRDGQPPEVVPLDPGLPLGGATDLSRTGDGAAFGTSRLRMERGDTVLFFTDGLIERPGSPLDDGLARLISVVGSLSGRRDGPRRPHGLRRRGASSRGTGAGEMCWRIVTVMQETDPRPQRDDAALLTFRRTR